MKFLFWTKFFHWPFQKKYWQISLQEIDLIFSISILANSKMVQKGNYSVF